MTLRLASIVEGHGDVKAVPVLLRRLAARSFPGTGFEILHPIRIPRSRLLKPGEIEKAVDLAGRQVQYSGGIVVLVDAEDDCPAELGPKLLARARSARPDIALSLVLAKREFESWFLAAARSLQGKRALPADLEPPPHPESIGGAKEWLSDRMPSGRKYVETLDQPALTAVFDMEQASVGSASFARCLREIGNMLSAIGPK